MNNYCEKMEDTPAILGVELKQLRSFPDDRGFFREIIRVTDEFFAADDSEASFAQWSHAKMTKDVVKAWHYHHVQTDWWYVGLGQVQAVLCDWRPESPTYKSMLSLNLGEADCYPDTHEICLKIPTGVLHGLRVLSDTAHLFYITSRTYNPEDEGRIPYDSDLVPHDWGTGAVTVANDRRAFEPTQPRRRLF